MAAPKLLADKAPPLLHGHKAGRRESTLGVGTGWLYDRGGTVLFSWRNSGTVSIFDHYALADPTLEQTYKNNLCDKNSNN